MYAKQYLDKPVAFWKQVLWSDEVTRDPFATITKGMFGGKKGAAFDEINTLINFKHGSEPYNLGLCSSR